MPLQLKLLLDRRKKPN